MLGRVSHFFITTLSYSIINRYICNKSFKSPQNMSKIFTSLKKYRSPILNTLTSILCLIIIYESLFVEIRYFRVAIFGILLISNISDLILFWKNKSN